MAEDLLPDDDENRLPDFAIMQPTPPTLDDPEAAAKDVEEAASKPLFGGPDNHVTWFDDGTPPEPPETTTLTRKVPPKPNQMQILYLYQNPELAGQFDEMFGFGAAAQYLKQDVKPPTPKQNMELAPPPVGPPELGVGKGDLPENLQSYIALQDSIKAAKHEDAASQSLSTAHRNDAIENWDHEAELKSAEQLALGWRQKFESSPLGSQERDVAARGMRAAEARLKVARELMEEKKAQMPPRIGTPKGRIMVETIIAAQREELARAEGELEAQKAAANYNAPPGIGEQTGAYVNSVVLAQANLERQRQIMHYLEQKADELRSSESVDNPTVMGELTRGLLRFGFGTVPKLLGEQIQGIAITSTEPESLQQQVIKPIGDAIVKWADKAIRDVAAPVYRDGMWEIKSATDLKWWAAKTFGEGLGSVAGVLIPTIMFGPTAGAATAIAMSQGEMKDGLEEAFAARGKEIPPDQLFNYMMIGGTLMGGLDAIGFTFMLGGLKGAVRQKVRTRLIGWLADRSIKGFGVESGTEGLQELIQIMATHQALELNLTPDLAMEYAKRLTEAMVAGGMVGGMFGIAGGAKGYVATKEFERRKQQLSDKIIKELQSEIAEREQGQAPGVPTVEGTPTQPVPVEPDATQGFGFIDGFAERAGVSKEEVARAGLDLFVDVAPDDPRLSGRNVTLQLDDVETGPVEVEMPAGEAFRMIDRRLKGINQLIGCLS